MKKTQKTYKILLLILINLYFTQANESIISPNLYSISSDDKSYEIHHLNYVGNKEFDKLTLNSFLTSSQSNRGIAHTVMEYYYKNIKINPATPAPIVREFKKAVNKYKDEISIFKQSSVQLDSTALWNFYNTQGFHNVEIYYTFLPDTLKKENILTFYINENKRFTIDTVVYLGLELLPSAIMRDVNSMQTIRHGDQFKENNILKEAFNIQNYLLDNGYFYTKFECLPVIKDSSDLSDSITVIFDIGKRQKIAQINFIDSNRNQSLIASDMKYKQLEFKKGDWYSKKSFKISENNFNSLGVFDIAIIDTSSEFLPLTDSTISVVVELRYKKQLEWAIALFGNQTQFDKLVNVGIEGNVMHKNIFGAAQSINLYTNAQIKDFSSFVSGASPDYEFQIGTRINQPLLWQIENMRIGASGSLQYSYYKLNNFFNLFTTSLPIKFPIKLTNGTYLNQISVDFSFERQSPSDLQQAISNYKSSNDKSIDSVVLQQNLFLMGNLERYLNQPETHFLTSNLFGITLIGDSRNHPFSPTGGDYFLFTLDGWNIFLAHPLISGISRFFRVQSAYSSFYGLTDNLSTAFKLKAGTTYLFKNQNGFIPFDRQFFVGGANSVRGWSSRQLHYSIIDGDPNYSGSDINFLSSFIGSGTVIEGSFELRFKFSRPSGWERMLAEQIERIGFVAFIDFGNAFNWFAENEKVKSDIKLTDYVTKLAWAFGLGFRYDTPFGPLRVDAALPLYRPYINGADYFLFNQRNMLKDFQLHLGIGQAF